jgi:hypothetical protein
MSEEYKTLRELDVKPGDVVEWNIAGKKHTEKVDSLWKEWSGAYLKIWRIVSRAPSDDTAVDKPVLWRDMTDAERGALLLAHHRGKVIQFKNVFCEPHDWRSIKEPIWADAYAYRVKPAPKVETVALCWRYDVGTVKNKIGTINLKDGKPDFASIKPEGL